MITVRIKIGDGNVVDTTTYGLVYLDSDKRIGAPLKEYDVTTYPEEEGEHFIPKTVDAPFDYKVKFFIQADSLQNANAKIKAFNDMLFSQESGSDVKTFKQVEFYNDYKRHKIVGYPQPMAEATEFWQDRKNQINDVVVVEWTIRVTKPSLCDFNLTASSQSAASGDSESTQNSNDTGNN